MKLNRSLRRAGLLASTALLFAGAQVAQAQVVTGPGAPSGTPEAQGSAGKVEATAPEAQAGPKIVSVSPEPEILISNPGTPTTARDATNITGVGQMVINNGGGTVGLCTGTLINPRTVIFAAHCVNSRAATAYGGSTGGTPIMFGFEANLRAEAPGAPDELLQWLFGALAGKTNIASSVYNVNQVVYNDFSLEPDAASFLYGDVALATLDTPAADIPTWALLFSPLPDPGAIGAAGTGYNVAITGYGRNGTGSTGAGASIDFRRRSAENMIGALTDLETFESFLFGGPANGLKQNLYFMDFDDPLRGTPGASIFDFNAFRDPARIKDGVPSEGTTSSGDSGGPLILQNFAKQVVIGVLSGGYTRFFNGQPANSYGTANFYQPLYLYWDWIAANNPYHYVSAKAGNGSWTDPNHWLTTLDPAYMILSGGSLVNGLPTTPGEQKNGTSGDFGQVCFESTFFGSSECLDTATGAVINTNPPAAAAENNAATATIAENSAGTQGIETRVFSEVMLESQAEATPVLPAATLANGLPGATGFVPNNADPVRETGTRAQYYDVTLTAAGTTTLSGADITIDRLTIGTAAANLVVASGASLTTLMGTTQFAGTNTVNGTFTSVGDYSLLGGALFGSGRINAPFVTSVMGQIAPGTTTSIGTLTFGGNLIMSSATGYLINLGPNGTSDRISVVAHGASLGAANIGGALGISPLAGTTVRYGDRYTILSAEGGVTGTFSSPAALSAILRPTALYTSNAVQLRIDAASYASVVSTSSPVQVAYAQLLDANRTIGGMPGLYDVLDLQSAGTIRATLDALAPRTETLRSSIGTVALDNTSRLIRQRLGTLKPGSLGGTVAYVGRPVQTLAYVGNLNRGIQHFQGPDGGMTETRTAEGRLPETMSAFLAGGYLDGESRPMATALPLGGNDQFDGWYLAGGIEAELGSTGLIGFALSYTDVDGKTGVGGGTVKGQLIQGTLYAKRSFGVLYGETQMSAGLFRTDASRDGSLPGNTYRLNSKDDVMALAAEVNIGAEFGEAIKFGPRIGLRAGWFDFGRSVETGGPTALVYDRFDARSVQGRGGFVLNGVGKIRPTASVNYVHEFRDQPTSLAARFVGGLQGVNPGFALAGFDKDWIEAAAGLTLTTGNVDISLSADTTIARDDVKNQAYRASVSFRF
ncbi:autotransporter domain-containing protein [Novosphingobium sp.]|uniref:autotransporter domain-containing protein n=1 Tax=Novosphingobium sp. TaxID=1874826 RepID=UPI002732D365|nr:autotransporter domain-containing protein [Novosphingobium sp.]MDP3906465.1 autotransporter domain-containing protein [Novosphingobium sp.]